MAWTLILSLFSDIIACWHGADYACLMRDLRLCADRAPEVDIRAYAAILSAIDDNCQYYQNPGIYKVPVNMECYGYGSAGKLTLVIRDPSHDGQQFRIGTKLSDTEPR
jgi:hypothetical protein